MDQVGIIPDSYQTDNGAGMCPGHSFPSIVILKAVIYGDNNQIYGIRFITINNGYADLGRIPSADEL